MEKLLDILGTISSPIKRKDCNAWVNKIILNSTLLVNSPSLNFKNNIFEEIKIKKLLFGQTKNIWQLEENEVSIDWFDTPMEFSDTEEMHEVLYSNHNIF
ncbi:hypothetical protein [Spiroplasma endosymbiont of Labia minor]|uniref:hypothetical protein n=1 Tax=Spiroplasma endosymbiont of Labia minor TaxID=3066305 RepID=UPI0030D18C70